MGIIPLCGERNDADIRLPTSHTYFVQKSIERESLLKICLEYQKLNFFCPFVSESTFVSRFKSVKKGN